MLHPRQQRSRRLSLAIVALFVVLMRIQFVDLRSLMTRIRTNAPLPDFSYYVESDDNLRLVNKIHVPPCQNEDFRPRHERAVFTMLTDDGIGSSRTYVKGTLKLGVSVLRHLANVDLVVLELASKPLSRTTWKRLSPVWTQRCVVDRIPQHVETHNRFRDQFTKLRLWGITSYKLILYLDSDTLVVGSLEDLLSTTQRTLESKTNVTMIAAARDYHHGKWQNKFNMGVALVQPNEIEYRRLLGLHEHNSIQYHHDKVEQEWLNVVYKNRWTDIGFVYNGNNALYLEDSGNFWKSQEDDLRIIHYAKFKPWAYWVPGSRAYKPLYDIWDKAPMSVIALPTNNATVQTC